MSVDLSIYQALDGDCIHLRFGYDYKINILIDVGYLESYKETLKKTIGKILKNKEFINLLVITHIDEDHISGIKGLMLEKNINSLIKKVWFNTASIFRIKDNTNNISFNDGNKASKFLLEQNIDFNSFISNDMNVIDFYGAKITVLSPESKDLTKFISSWDRYNKSHEISGHARDWGESIENLYKKPYNTDPSESNRVSISFLFKFDSTKILFLGDSNHSIISKRLIELGYSSLNPLVVDFVKLSHHGSKYNISNKMIEIIDCNKFIISSNGRNLYKETLSRILMNKNRDTTKKITFYFNYPKEYYNNLFCENDFLNYNFTCEYSKPNDKEICIEV